MQSCLASDSHGPQSDNFLARKVMIFLFKNAFCLLFIREIYSLFTVWQNNNIITGFTPERFSFHLTIHYPYCYLRVLPSEKIILIPNVYFLCPNAEWKFTFRRQILWANILITTDRYTNFMVLGSLHIIIMHPGMRFRVWLNWKRFRGV